MSAQPLIPLADGSCMTVRELLETTHSKELLCFCAWFCAKEFGSQASSDNEGNGSAVGLLSGGAQEIAEIETMLRIIRTRRAELMKQGYGLLLAAEHVQTEQVVRLHEVGEKSA